MPALARRDAERTSVCDWLGKQRNFKGKQHNGWVPISYTHRLLRSYLYLMLRPDGGTPVVEMYLKGKVVGQVDNLAHVNCPSKLPNRTSLTSGEFEGTTNFRVQHN
jgi:hypothetical protein